VLLPPLKLQNPQTDGAVEDAPAAPRTVADAPETPRLERLVALQEVPSWGAVEAPALEQCLEVRRVPSCRHIEVDVIDDSEQLPECERTTGPRQTESGNLSG
jgi:hypothetical protein